MRTFKTANVARAISATATITEVKVMTINEHNGPGHTGHIECTEIDQSWLRVPELSLSSNGRMRLLHRHVVAALPDSSVGRLASGEVQIAYVVCGFSGDPIKADHERRFRLSDGFEFAPTLRCLDASSGLEDGDLVKIRLSSTAHNPDDWEPLELDVVGVELTNASVVHVVGTVASYWRHVLRIDMGGVRVACVLTCGSPQQAHGSTIVSSGIQSVSRAGVMRFATVRPLSDEPALERLSPVQVLAANALSSHFWTGSLEQLAALAELAAD